ncbi:MAG TPA: ABC transporter substrate-binding protein [Candidatus Wallbacteria bacterium]|nr:ABC transporter substrate-binding protein [Candidatus Wallbacteria bacterium]
MKNKIFYCFCLLLALSLACGCEFEIGKASQRERKIDSFPAINVGVVWPLESNYKNFVNGIIMASDEINLSGGLLGKRLNIVFRDDESSVTRGMMIADEFAANPEIFAALGFCNSYVTIPVSKIYSDAGIVMINTTSVDPAFNSFNSPLLFRTAPNANDIAVRLAGLIDKLGYKKAAMCYVNDDYGLCSANACEDELNKLSISVVDRRSYSSGNASEFKQIIDCWKLLKFDCALFFGGPPEGPQFIRLVRRAGILTPIFCGDGMNYSEFISQAGEYSEGVIVTSFFNPFDTSSLKKSKFIDEYKNRFGKPPDTYSAQAYDALKILAEAVKRAGSAVPKRVSAAMRAIKNEEGVIANYEFDEKGEVINEKIILKIVRDKKFIYIGSTGEVDLIKNSDIKWK